jgi:hypothetical protein
MDKIDWNKKEDNNAIKRPFIVDVEEDVARNFIDAVKSNGLFVREVIVKLMKEYGERYGSKGRVSRTNQGNS